VLTEPGGARVLLGSRKNTRSQPISAPDVRGYWTGAIRNVPELRLGKVRRISLPRTSVNRT
jgi:hypothetical protein